MSEETKLMNAWRVVVGDKNPLQLKRIPIPTPAADGVLVKILAMGVCHTDCFIRDTKSPRPGDPAEFTLGHEGAGEIVKLGSNVSKTSLSVGDKVAIHIIPGCKQCSTCKIGLNRICQSKDSGGYGLGRDGMGQEYLHVRADACVKIPEGVSIEEAAISSDALLTAYHAVKNVAEVKPGQTVAIVGLGGLGLNGLQVAQHLKASRILVIDKRQESVDIAVRLGVPREDAFCSGAPDAPSVQEVIKEKGVLVDTVIDFVGHEQTFLTAQRTVRAAGLIVLVGLLSPQVPFVTGINISKLLTVKGSFSGEIDGLRECLKLIADGQVRPELETGSIKDLPQVLRDLDEGKYQGRKVLLPDWNDAAVSSATDG